MVPSLAHHYCGGGANRAETPAAVLRRMKNLPRRCFLHIGTHKTGSTSLQVLLYAHPTVLQAHGCLYPKTGRSPDSPAGHHDIAWEISGDARHQRAYGTIDDLAVEIASVPHDIILSSEDFECSICQRDAFASF